MIGTPREKAGKCQFCSEVLGERGVTDVPFTVERYDEDGEEVRLPKYIKPYAELTYIFKGDEVVPQINAAATVADDGFVAMTIDVRFCPYCGRDLFEEMNEEQSA